VPVSRIRTIKPEFWTSAQVMECSPCARLLFIGMWNFCDDHGRHPASDKQLKALIFPGDDFPVSTIRGMIDELSAHGLIRLYEVGGKEFFEVTGWKHQKIDKAQPAKYPPPGPDPSQPFAERSSNALDGREKEGKGEEKDSDPIGSVASQIPPSAAANSETRPNPPEPRPNPPDPDAELFRRGKEILGRNGGGQIARLKLAFGGDIAKTRELLEHAASRSDPSAYIGAAINKRSTGPPNARESLESRGYLYEV
jgi:hypothetical protein